MGSKIIWVSEDIHDMLVKIKNMLGKKTIGETIEYLIDTYGSRLGDKKEKKTVKLKPEAYKKLMLFKYTHDFASVDSVLKKLIEMYESENQR